MNTLPPFERSGTTRPMTRLSHHGRTEPFETSLCETQISHCWTWLIPTLHESAGTRDKKKKPLLTRCGSFKIRIPINTIFTLYMQMEHWRNKQLGIQKKIKRWLPVPRYHQFEMSIFVLNMTKCPVAYALVSFSEYLYNNRSPCAIWEVFPRSGNRCPGKSGFSEFLYTVQQPVCWHPEVHNVRDF